MIFERLFFLLQGCSFPSREMHYKCLAGWKALDGQNILNHLLFIIFFTFFLFRSKLRRPHGHGAAPAGRGDQTTVSLWGESSIPSSSTSSSSSSLSLSSSSLLNQAQFSSGVSHTLQTLLLFPRIANIQAFLKITVLCVCGGFVLHIHKLLLEYHYLHSMSV